jgi:galactose mutarotase-like enzyme
LEIIARKLLIILKIDALSNHITFMFAIAVEQRQYETYVLTDSDTSSRLEIVPSRGGIVTSWQVDGNEIFYLDAERYTHPDLSVRGGIPILFPICGNLPNDTYTYNGKTYTLKQHGFARDLPWQVSTQSTQDNASLTLLLESNDKTLVSYPFDFQVAFTYKLQGNCLTIQQRYTNRSNSVMPFAAGFHPYFAVTDKRQLQFDLPATQYWDNVTKSMQSYPGYFDYDLDEIDAAFLDFPATSVLVSDRSQNLNLNLSYDPAFTTMVFWTVKGKDFYCLEPWTAGRNAMNTGKNLIAIEPGASFDTSVSFTANFDR